METFLSLVKNQGHKSQKKVRRWKVYFALNFNISLKEFLKTQL